MSESQAIVASDGLTAAGLEQVIIGGDLDKLSPADRLRYYENVCRTLGLNPLTKPFEYIKLNNKLTLYARRDCTDQLRKIHKVNITKLIRERIDDVYVVTATAETPDGRLDESIGAVSIAGLRGEMLANAFMKAETKAKRRVTLSIVGLGWLDETEIETVPSATPSEVNTETGEITQPVQIAPPKPAQHPATPPQAKVSRKALENRYDFLFNNASFLDLEPAAEKRDPAWPDTTLMEKGIGLAARVTAAENAAQQKAAV